MEKCYKCKEQAMIIFVNDRCVYCGETIEKYHMQNVIYDTLMQNTQFETLELFDVVNPCISRDEISFDYRGKHVFIRILIEK